MVWLSCLSTCQESLKRWTGSRLFPLTAKVLVSHELTQAPWRCLKRSLPRVLQRVSWAWGDGRPHCSIRGTKAVEAPRGGSPRNLPKEPSRPWGHLCQLKTSQPSPNWLSSLNPLSDPVRVKTAEVREKRQSKEGSHQCQLSHCRLPIRKQARSVERTSNFESL